jgi:hypothetical protein
MSKTKPKRISSRKPAADEPRVETIDLAGQGEPITKAELKALGIREDPEVFAARFESGILHIPLEPQNHGEGGAVVITRDCETREVDRETIFEGFRTDGGIVVRCFNTSRGRVCYKMPRLVARLCVRKYMATICVHGRSVSDASWDALFQAVRDVLGPKPGYPSSSQVAEIFDRADQHRSEYDHINVFTTKECPP